jgi:hypothetical protein
VKRVAKACNRSAHMGRMGLAGNQKEPSLHLRADELE